MKKWRETLVDPLSIKLNNNLIIKKVVSYPPAGNDVFECVVNVNNIEHRAFLKISRGPFADIETEVLVLPLIPNINIKVPKVLDYGKIDNHDYVLTTKVYGSKLSNLIKKGAKSKDYLFDYGKKLAEIHSINIRPKLAKQRKINNMVNVDIEVNVELEKIYNYLINNQPIIEFDTFIHGDFHYGNLLFKNKKINAIIDWEYSGVGFKEQDIAWSLIPRPSQQFLLTKEEVNLFLEGYKSLGNFDMAKFKWCYINGCVHFYLMNKNNSKYQENLLKIINEILGD